MTGDCPSIHLDINFEEPLTTSCLAHIVIDLLKHLLHQRHQIPLPYERIQFDVRSIQPRPPFDPTQTEQAPSVGLSVREQIQYRRNQVRQATLAQRFHRTASNFLQNFESLTRNLTEAIIAHEPGNGAELKCVAIIFGPTPLSPKEIYHVRLPEGWAMATSPRDSGDGLQPHNEPSQARKKANLKLFRAMVNHEHFFAQTGQPLALTNVFVALKKRSEWVSSEWLTPKEELAHVRRGHRVFFHLHNAPDTQDMGRRKKMRFAPETAETPGRWKPSGRYTPMAMDLCTPAPVVSTGAAGRHRRPSSMDMVETPCQFHLKASRRKGDRLPLIPSAPLFEPSVMEASLFEEEDMILEQDWEDEQANASHPEFSWFVTSQLIRGFKDPRVIRSNKGS
ncbi:hypothetical protein TCAL_00349 [Tigriopus californicus]|uniref:Uncharacterized protein n=1 Tax=Tigriopus californicus TaxID=6832 RepID=A0A553NCQ7_TIGCA|nr:uncharacterized protein LOC131889440 [Tigriopus californicus]TRY63139.1 hypothetical protein TCAL_00349 [Tigriopus californicus]|eukprot:TCALIF_00349-PA protein Name:"Similar to Mad2l1bp MAD2L1-binding protein (Mus musculus)" AED:0.20 eAED:0.35 QI:0/-1/0/1/-1/1/1/0/392